MNTNLNVNNNRPSFGIKVSENFQKAVRNYYNGVEYRPERAKQFKDIVNNVENNFGYDEFTLQYKKQSSKNGTLHTLVADNGIYEVPITTKDQFRKVIEKFKRLTKGELYVKIKDFRNLHPEYKHLT